MSSDNVEGVLTYQEVWETLSKINVNEHTKEKNGLAYLSWAWAWQTMMEHYPQMQVGFGIFPVEGNSPANLVSDAMFYPNGTASVHCKVKIDNLEREMWLPVMTGYQNKAVEYPGARDIGDAKMRCMVKCFALYGLGHYIYAGEDLPRQGEPEPELSPEVRDRIAEIVALGKELTSDGQKLPKELRSQISKAIKEEDLAQLDQCFQDLTSLQDTRPDSSDTEESDYA